MTDQKYYTSRMALRLIEQGLKYENIYYTLAGDYYHEESEEKDKNFLLEVVSPAVTARLLMKRFQETQLK